MTNDFLPQSLRHDTEWRLTGRQKLEPITQAIDAAGCEITWGGSPAGIHDEWVDGKQEQWNPRFVNRIEKTLGTSLSFGWGWADHARRVKENGKWVYYSHPYKLDSDDLAQLVKLHEAGYKIHIDGSSRYFVGRTVCILLEEPGKEKRR